MEDNQAIQPEPRRFIVSVKAYLKAHSVLVFLIVAVLITLPASVWFFASLKGRQSAGSQESVTPPPPSGWEFYESEEYGFSLNHPHEWAASESWKEEGLPKTAVYFLDERGELAVGVVSLEVTGSLGGQKLSLVKEVLAKESLPNLSEIGGSSQVQLFDNWPEVRDGYSSRREVEIMLNCPEGTEEIMISEAPDFTGAFWEPRTALRPWTFSDGDGLKTIFVRFRLQSGEILEDSATFGLDTLAPFGGIGIERFAVGPRAMELTVYLGAEDNLSGARDLRFGLTPDFQDEPWRAYSTQVSLFVDRIVEENPHGTEIPVYVQYRDLVGNVSDVYSDYFVIDKEPPVLYVEVEPGDSPTHLVKILAYDELSQIAKMYLCNDPRLLEGVVSMPYQQEVEWTFDERRVVWVQLEDSEGNLSEPYPTYARTAAQAQSQVTEDLTPPLDKGEQGSKEDEVGGRGGSETQNLEEKGSKTVKPDLAFLKTAGSTERVVESFWPDFSKVSLSSKKVGGYSPVRAIYEMSSEKIGKRRLLLTTYAVNDLLYIVFTFLEIDPSAGDLVDQGKWDLYEKVVSSFCLL